VISLAVVMPVFNEGDGLVETLRELEKVGVLSDSQLLLFVQDDVSNDDSLEIIRSFQSERLLLHLESNTARLGHGPSVRRGYERAVDCSCDVTVQLDGDGQFRSEDVVRLIAAVRGGMDFALATRTHRSSPGYRRLATKSLRFLCGLLFKTKFADINSPVRAFNTHFLAGLLPSIPKNSAMTNVYLSVLSSRFTQFVDVIEVVDHARRGNHHEGSTWRSARSNVSSPLRFMRFAITSFMEVLRFRLRVYQRSNDSTMFCETD
jgi:glycosyltransferase involved in cell wall biosynthesis